ncbi:MAG: SEC-C domain-containing protein [Thermoanaerobaculia bacterium]|nr:SEC-C domain-containing protein [Thermoanaerobaculia bacterium]
MSKRGRNDLCWCGSDKKYKRCHGGRLAPTTPPEVVASDIRRKDFLQGSCLFPGTSTCQSAIRCHTIQRRNVLRELLDPEARDREVSQIFWNFLDAARGIQPWRVESVGWKQASTSPLFCAKHDNSLFSTIESVDFSATAEQCFLFGYRSACFELQRKRAVVAMESPILEFHQYFGTLRTSNVESYRRYCASARMGESELSTFKAKLDGCYLDRAWGAWESAVLFFSGRLEVAAAGSITPNRDFCGNQLQDVGDLSLRRSPEVAHPCSVKVSQIEIGRFHQEVDLSTRIIDVANVSGMSGRCWPSAAVGRKRSVPWPAPCGRVNARERASTAPQQQRASRQRWPSRRPVVGRGLRERPGNVAGSIVDRPSR